MEMTQLLKKYPEVRDEMIRLQQIASKQMIDHITEENRSTESSDREAFTRGNLYGRFALFTEMILGTNDTQGYDTQKVVVIEKQCDCEVHICEHCDHVPCFCHEALASKPI